MIKTTRWEQQYSIREPERYAWYSHWSIGHGQLSGSSEKRKNQYYKVISVFVCLYVCLKLNNYRTAGLIWLNFYLLAQSLSRDGFRPTKPDPGSGFSKNPEKPILAGKGESLAATLCRGGGCCDHILRAIELKLGMQT